MTLLQYPLTLLGIPSIVLPLSVIRGERQLCIFYIIQPLAGGSGEQHRETNQYKDDAKKKAIHGISNAQRGKIKRRNYRSLTVCEANLSRGDNTTLDPDP